MNPRDTSTRGPVSLGCGVHCRGYDWRDGTCDIHGPTAEDRIVKAGIAAFRSDLDRIMAARKQRKRPANGR